MLLCDLRDPGRRGVADSIREGYMFLIMLAAYIRNQPNEWFLPQIALEDELFFIIF